MGEKKNTIYSTSNKMGTRCKKWVFDMKTKLLDRKIFQRHAENEGLMASLDAKALSIFNFEKRKALVAHAVKHSSFYRDKYAPLFTDPAAIRTEEDFTQLPILTREELQLNFGSITADNLRK